MSKYVIGIDYGTLSGRASLVDANDGNNCFYLSNEGVSLLENAAHLGLPIPEKLKAILAQLHNRDESALPDGDEKEANTDV